MAAVAMPQNDGLVGGGAQVAPGSRDPPVMVRPAMLDRGVRTSAVRAPFARELTSLTQTSPSKNRSATSRTPSGPTEHQCHPVLIVAISRQH